MEALPASEGVWAFSCLMETCWSGKVRGMTVEHIEIVKEELRAYEENLSYALVTIVKTDGHTTRANGKMLVYEDGKIFGTIGGGAIERLAVRDAVEAIHTGDGGTRFYDMNTDASADGLACGGSMEVLIEVYGNRPTLVMCGAGHVGAALMPIARSVGFRILLLDNRGEAFVSDKLCLADKFIPVKDYENDIKELAVPAGAYYVIAGPNHDCDGAALAGALTKESAYVGMIGGEKKIRAISARLLEKGFTQDQINSVHMPVGLDISSGVPEEIAISILSEILMVKNRKNRPSGL